MGLRLGNGISPCFFTFLRGEVWQAIPKSLLFSEKIFFFLFVSFVGQLNPGVRVLGFLITMPRKEAIWWWWWTWTRTYSPQQQALVLLSVSIDNIYYVIQYRCWCRNQWLSSSSQVVLANDCNGSTIGMYHEQKLQPDSNVLRIHILHIMKGSHASTMAQLP